MMDFITTLIESYRPDGTMVPLTQALMTLAAIVLAITIVAANWPKKGK